MWRRVRRAAVRSLAALGFLVLVVTFTPLTEWWARRLAGPWLDPKGETLIVLGGSMQDYGVLGQSSYWRAMYGARVYQKEGFHRVVVSGGPHGNPASDAIARFMNAEGVPAGVMVTETESKSTRENALFVTRMLSADNSRKVLLTSDYHMYRASRAFAKAGLSVIPRPFPDAIKRAQWRIERWSVFLALNQEAAKIIYYYIRGWI